MPAVHECQRVPGLAGGSPPRTIRSCDVVMCGGILPTHKVQSSGFEKFTFPLDTVRPMLAPVPMGTVVRALCRGMGL